MTPNLAAVLFGPQGRKSVDAYVRARLPAWDTSRLPCPLEFYNATVIRGRVSDLGSNLGPCLRSPNPELWIPRCLEGIQKSLSTEALTYGACKELDQMLGTVEALLECAAPDILIGLSQLVTDVVPVFSAELRSSTVPAAFGAVFVGVGSHQTVATTLELIVHEAAHLVVHAMNTETPLLKSNKLLPSPLRSDLRPSIAVLHAGLVCSAVCQVAHAVIGWLPTLPLKIELADVIYRNRKDSRSAITTVLNYGEPTLTCQDIIRLT